MLWALWMDLYDSMVCIGCRDGYKTLTLGISEVLDLVFKDCGIVHIGAIDQQARKCYSYVRRYLDDEFVAAVDNSIMSSTVTKEGGTLQIIPCTMKQVNSPHEPKVRFDEVELADEAAYADAKGIPSSDGKGNTPSICYTTTRKFAFGLAQREIDIALKNGDPVFMWCYLDITERCPFERHGGGSVIVWINRDILTWQMEAPNLADHGSFSPEKLKSAQAWQQFDVSYGCLECPIIATCCGRLRTANGCKPIGDIIVKFKTSTVDFWKNQMECRKPSTKGLVIWAFDEETHAANFEIPRNWREMEWFVVGGKDFNYTPQPALLCFVTNSQLIVYDEIYMETATVRDCSKEMNKRWFDRFGRPQTVECDATRPDSISDMHKDGIPEAVATECRDVESSVDYLNTLFCPSTLLGGRVFNIIQIHRTNCPNLIWELSQGYRRAVDNAGKIGKIIAENNHYVDCLRYVAFKYMRNLYPAYEERVEDENISREFYGKTISLSRD